MAHQKYKMPSVNQFLGRKRMYDKMKVPVWEYLEEEMQANLDKKPYNERVGDWLKFLKDFKRYQYFEAKRKYKRLQKDVGPAWYCELSGCQREVLQEIKQSIHLDIIEDLPVRVRKCLNNLGLTLNIKRNILMKAMKDSCEDPAIFVWNLYKAIYKTPPSELLAEYDTNAMILMSSLVFIDLKECVETLEKLTACEKPPPPPPPKPKKLYYEPKVRYGQYLQKIKVPLNVVHPDPKGHSNPPFQYKLKLRSVESYENLCLDHAFIARRKERNKKEKQSERICTYKFWEPPASLRNSDPKMAAYIIKLRMLKKRPKIRHLSMFENVQYQVGSIAFAGGRPHYVINSVAVMPTGHIPINGGAISMNGEFITVILGMWIYPKIVIERCDKECDCLTKWEKPIMDFIKNASKCQCAHHYNLKNTGKVSEKYFYPPTKHFPLWFDKAKVFQMDPTEDFIKDTVEAAVRTKDPTPAPSAGAVVIAGLKEKELLAALLCDISGTPLVIPHLPQANLLNNLQEWVRQRVRGNLLPSMHRKLKLQTARRWLDLKHLDFKAPAYKIPFTMKELHHMNWSHRGLVQELFVKLLDNFVSRNRVKLTEQTRIWWPTTKYDKYPNEAFLDIFFTYMSGRMKDIQLISPYGSDLKRPTAKTCPLNF